MYAVLTAHSKILTGEEGVIIRKNVLVSPNQLARSVSEEPAANTIKFYAKTFLRLSEKYIVILVIIAMWEILPRYGVIDSFLLPPFSTVMKDLGTLFWTGEMFRHIAKSLTRSGIAFFVAVTFSIIMGWFRRCERIMDPLLQACRNTSTLALYPVFILFFGLGELAKISIITWGAIWPTLLNTIKGVKNVDPQLIKLARSMGVSTPGLFFKVIFPMALPSIATGIRLSSASALLILVAAEMLGADQGLGFMIFYYQERYAIPTMFGGIITIAVIGVAINYLLVHLERRIVFWREKVVKF